jgi:histidine triad (HIT) family protein
MEPTDCVFCRIVARTADALIIHEDDRVTSFLALHPAVNGHTLVVPKAHHADLYSLPPDLLSALLASCQLHAQRWRDQLGSTGINLLHATGADAGQSVFHFHLHLFPRFAGDGLHAWPTLPRPAQTREQMHATFRLSRL